MSIFKIKFGDEFEDEEFDNYEDADEYGMYLASCTAEGAEILHMSNPGDYDEDDYDNEYEIVRVDD